MSLINRDLKHFRATGLGNRVRGWYRRLVMPSNRSLLNAVNNTAAVSPDRSVAPRPWRYHVHRWTQAHASAL